MAAVAAAATAPQKGCFVDQRRWLRPSVGCLLFLLWLLSGQSRAETDRYDPRSRIQRPHGTGVAYLAAAAALGQLGEGQGVEPGYSVAVIFRPHRAADFHHALFAWNTALVLQVDRQGDDGAATVSGDLIARRYFGDMRAAAAGRAMFAGLGAGISRAEWGAGQEAGAGTASDLSFLLEAGLEWNLNPALVLVGKGQYRLLDRDGRNHSGWSLHLGAGVPLPF